MKFPFRELVRRLLMTACDLCTSAKPWSIHVVSVKKVYEEFYLQVCTTVFWDVVCEGTVSVTVMRLSDTTNCILHISLLFFYFDPYFNNVLSDLVPSGSTTFF